MKNHDHEIHLVQELKDFIARYNFLYFNKLEKDAFNKKYWLPKIGFEIKDREKFPGIDSNIDVSDGEWFDRSISSSKQVRESMGGYGNGTLFSVVFSLAHKDLLWRVCESESQRLYIYEIINDHTTSFSSKINKGEEKYFKTLGDIINYIQNKIVETFEKFPPGSSI